MTSMETSSHNSAAAQEAMLLRKHKKVRNGQTVEFRTLNMEVVFICV